MSQGVIISLKDSEGVIKSEEHGELPFNINENFSDVEFTAEDVNEEVEFTVVTVRTRPVSSVSGGTTWTSFCPLCLLS